MIGLGSVVALLLLLLIGCAAAPAPHPVTYQSYPAVKERAGPQRAPPPAVSVGTRARPPGAATAAAAEAHAPPPGLPAAADAADPAPCVTQSGGAMVISRDVGCR